VHKRLEGPHEPILDPDLVIVDAHHHLFDRAVGRYLLGEYVADVALGHRVVASVYVETLAMARQSGPESLRPLGEIEFANGVGAMSASGGYGSCRVASAIVGYADLRAGAAVGDLLDQSASRAPDRFRGVRQVALDGPDPSFRRFITNPPPSGLLEDSGFLAGLRELERRGLSFDAAVFHHQLPRLAQIAGDYPNVQFVLNHVGMPYMIDLHDSDRAAVFDQWRSGLQTLAAQPNVACKIGGLGQVFFGFGFDTREDPVGFLELAKAWGPYVETAVEAFGVERCMMESNFPIDGRSCGFVPYWNAMKHIVKAASADDKAALFHGTAARVYRMQLDW
jgi:L-fuconolactonase